MSSRISLSRNWWRNPNQMTITSSPTPRQPNHQWRGNIRNHYRCATNRNIRSFSILKSPITLVMIWRISSILRKILVKGWRGRAPQVLIRIPLSKAFTDMKCPTVSHNYPIFPWWEATLAVTIEWFKVKETFLWVSPQPNWKNRIVGIPADSSSSIKLRTMGNLSR